LRIFSAIHSFILFFFGWIFDKTLEKNFLLKKFSYIRETRKEVHFLPNKEARRFYFQSQEKCKNEDFLPQKIEYDTFPPSMIFHTYKLRKKVFEIKTSQS